MKNLFKIACIISIFIPTMVLSGITEGSDIEDRCAMYMTPQKKVNLAFIPSSDGLVKVKIYDAHSNELIMTDKIKSEEGFNRTYNLGQLGSGSYLFEVIENDNYFRKEFNVLPSESMEPIIDLKRENEKAKLAVYGAKAPVQVHFYDQNHNLIFKDRINDAVNFKRDYDLKALRNSQIIIEITSGKKLIKQSFI